MQSWDEEGYGLQKNVNEHALIDFNSCFSLNNALFEVKVYNSCVHAYNKVTATQCRSDGGL